MTMKVSLGTFCCNYYDDWLLEEFLYVQQRCWCAANVGTSNKLEAVKATS